MATPEEMAAQMRANLKEKTGKDMAGWLKVAKASKKEKHGEIVKALKEAGLTHGYANLVAHELRGAATPAGASGGDPVEAQYSGKKAGLRPIYDAVLKAVQGLGEDVEVAPKKTYVSLRRSKQFALVQPSTATRVDLGINLKGRAPEGKLEASGSFNSMVSHRVRLESPKDVNAAVKRWLKAAYEAS